jgi:hypothetical protein
VDDRRAVRSARGRGVAIELVVEIGADRAVGERSDLDGAVGGGFETRDAERPRQAQDADPYVARSARTRPFPLCELRSFK